jgi:6-phosphogluconate dehydrogenase (decarboxylating)
VAHVEALSGVGKLGQALCEYISASIHEWLVADDSACAVQRVELAALSSMSVYVTIRKYAEAFWIWVPRSDQRWLLVNMDRPYCHA